MYSTLMNVKKSKDSLATSHRLPNLGRVVVTGNPATGWTLWTRTASATSATEPHGPDSTVLDGTPRRC